VTFRKYDELICTIPLDKLCNDVLNGEVPMPIKSRGVAAPSRAGFMVELGSTALPIHKSWIISPKQLAHSIVSHI